MNSVKPKYPNVTAWETAVKSLWFERAKALGGKLNFITLDNRNHLAALDCEIANFTIGRWEDGEGKIYDEMGKEIG